MSEAMSKREIEDVLSSIRRLVSHDVKRSDAVSDAPAEKLVLTPALRVEPAQNDDAAANARPLGTVSTPSQMPFATEQSPTTQSVVLKDIRGGADTTSLLGRIASAGEMAAREGSANTDGVQSLGEDAADQEPLPETDTQIAPALTDHPAPDHNVMETTMERESALPEHLNASDPSIEAATIEATLARLEEMLSNPAGGQAVTAAEDGASHDEDIIDEGMLYQLVAHIVRQELQGELGEKITRNIRKLVRAEVARELQLRQL